MPNINFQKSASSPEHWGLSDQQSRFFAEDSHCLCVACPGAGKTKTVIAKVARLSVAHGPTKVMAISFTKAGATELKSRLTQSLPPHFAKYITACTFHSLAYRTLRKSQEIKLINTGDQYDFLDRARQRVGTGLTLDALSESIAVFSRQLNVVAPEESSEHFESYQVFTEYQNALRSHGVMDMDHLMRNSLEGFRSGQISPPNLRAMIVDEFQDIDEIQYALITEFARNGTVIHVVGDDDQSIYSFRAGLGQDGMRRFMKDFDAAVLYLDSNYRCAPKIVETASRLIEYNSSRIAKSLISKATIEGSVKLLEYKNTQEEADAIVDCFSSASLSTKSKAVLARTNSGLDSVELAAVSRSIPIKRMGGQGFLQRRHIVNALAALKLGVKADDCFALVSSLHAAGISTSAIAHVEQAISSRLMGESPIGVLYNANMVEQLAKQDATLLREYRSALGTWVNACGEEYPSSDEIDEDAITTLLDYLSERGKNEYHRQDIFTLKRIVTEKLTGSIATRLRVIDNWSRRTKSTEVDHLPNMLALLTAHGAKGLEFDEVWIAGCNEKTFPHEKCDVEEERRLFYVALTRARAQVYMSYITDNKRERSRFVNETAIPLDESYCS